MISVRNKFGEDVAKALKTLKKKCDREKTIQTYKAKRFYEKPSVRKRAKAKAALKFKKTKPFSRQF